MLKIFGFQHRRPRPPKAGVAWAVLAPVLFYTSSSIFYFLPINRERIGFICGARITTNINCQKSLLKIYV